MENHKTDLDVLVAKLGSIHDLRELEGFANRRRYFPTLPRWSDEERAAILQRKYELEKRYGPYRRQN